MQRDEQLHVGVTASTVSTSRYCTAEKGNFTNLPDKTRASLQSKFM